MKMYVNWAEVLRDTPKDCVMKNLCSQDSEYLRALFESGLCTRYFTKQPPCVPDLGLLINCFKKTENVHKEIDCVLSRWGVPFEIFEFEGNLEFARCDNVPLWFDRSKNQFYKSLKRVGDGLFYKEINWVVVCNKVVRDSVHKKEGLYYFIIMPRAVFQLEETYFSCFDYKEEYKETPQLA